MLTMFLDVVIAIALGFAIVWSFDKLDRYFQTENDKINRVFNDGVENY